VTGADLFSARVSMLRNAEELISGDRDDSYGPPIQNFARTAAVLSGLGYRSPTGEIKPYDVAIMMSAVKLSRLMWSPRKGDSWTDLAGFAACGYECAIGEQEPNNGSTEKGCTCDECQAGHA
jgi:hypothetical protein